MSGLAATEAPRTGLVWTVIEVAVRLGKKFLLGLAFGAALYLIAAAAMGWFAGSYGLTVPQADTSQLQEAVAGYFGGSSDPAPTTEENKP